MGKEEQMPNRQKFANTEGGAEGTEEQKQEQRQPTEEHSNDSKAGEGEGKAEDKADEKELKYSDDDLDRIIARTIAKERARADKEIQKKEAEVSEAEKLKNMTELEKAQYEAKKYLEENETLKAERSLNEQKDIARKELSEAGITFGDELLDMFISPDAEKTKEALAAIKELWPKEVNKAVQAQLKRKAPDADSTHSDAPSFGASYAKDYSKNVLNGGI